MKLFRLVRLPAKGCKQQLIPMSKRDEQIQAEVNRRNEERRRRRQQAMVLGGAQPS